MFESVFYDWNMFFNSKHNGGSRIRLGRGISQSHNNVRSCTADQSEAKRATNWRSTLSKYRDDFPTMHQHIERRYRIRAHVTPS